MTSRLIVAIVCITAVLGVTATDASAGPAHAANGKYAAIDVVDGSNLTVKIRNNRVDFRDDGGTVCDDAGLGFVAARHRGQPVVIDAATVAVTADLECRGAAGWVSVIDDLTLSYSYDSGTGILTDSTGQTYTS